MMGKIKEWMGKLFDQIPKTVPGAAMKYILWYAVFLALCAMLNIIMLLADWWDTGRPNLSEMRQFLGMMVSGSAVAAIGFLGRWLVDKDGNGIPDEVEMGGERK